MAQKKLLLSLVVLLAFNFNASGEERFNFTKEDMDFAKDLARKSSQIGMDAIKEKWLELKKIGREKMLIQNGDELNLDQGYDVNELADPLVATSTLRVFVSTSMGTELLKNYVSQAKRYRAILVFNGLPQNSWRKLSELVYEIAGTNEEGLEIQLDDIAFAEYGVTSVPSFVLSTEPSVFDTEGSRAEGGKFDKVAGNIGIKRALEQMVEHGDLGDKAASFLTENES